MGFQKPNAGGNSKYPLLEFFRQYFKIETEMVDSAGDVNLYCPDYFHVPKRGHQQTDAPKYYVNMVTGKGYCHTCHTSHSDAEGFLMEKEGVSYGEAKSIITAHVGKPTDKGDNPRGDNPPEDPEPIPEAIVDKLLVHLLAQPLVLGFLQGTKRLTLETIKRYKLGFNGERVSTPIRDTTGQVRNIRLYKRGEKKNKVISWKKGYGRSRIFPVENLMERGAQPLVLFGGEFKVIAADQTSRTLPPALQWSSIAIVGGEGNLPKYLIQGLAEEILKGEPHVYVCFDIDQAGRDGAARIASLLGPLGIEVRRVDLPIYEPLNGDFNDYLYQGGTAEGFLELMANAQVLHVKQSDLPDGADETPAVINYIPLHLTEASRAEYAHKHIKSEVMVAGKDLLPYTVPQTVNYKCGQEWGEKCEGCGLAAFNGNRTISFPSDDAQMLTLLRATEKEVEGKLRAASRITAKCPFLRLQVEKYINVEEVVVTPELDFSATDREYATRVGYYVGHGIRPNKAYSIRAKSVPDPRNQYATLIITDAEDGRSSIDAFHMDDSTFEMLRVFQGPPEFMFDAISHDLSHNVTHIYGRDCIIKAADLVFHSALQFIFDGKLITRGWTEACIFGDTRTGKSETVKNLHRHYRLGEFIDCGNTSFAGLVGGMQQIGNKRWQITWGKIPLNNGGEATLDELSSLKLEIIGDMTGLRSSGVAEITKIHTERTMAQVRMIMLSNPRETGMSLDKYNYGLQGVQQLIGRPEDVARFDMVLAVKFDDSLDSLINSSKHEAAEHVFTSDACHNLVLWAWSRKPDQIHFDEDAEQACMEFATKMGKDFSPQFPVVISADQRIKLARLAVAVAMRTFSTDDGVNVYVRKEHVEYAMKFLYEIYDDPALGYRDYSKQLNFTRDRAADSKDVIIKWMVQRPQVCKLLMEMSTFKALDLIDLMSLNKDVARDILSFLREKGLIVPAGSATYRKEGHFISMLRSLPEYEKAAGELAGVEKMVAAGKKNF